MTKSSKKSSKNKYNPFKSKTHQNNYNQFSDQDLIKQDQIKQNQPLVKKRWTAGRLIAIIMAFVVLITLLLGTIGNFFFAQSLFSNSNQPNLNQIPPEVRQQLLQDVQNSVLQVQTSTSATQFQNQSTSQKQTQSENQSQTQSSS
jgi:predicted PurR-regulated permease PerM